MSTVTNGPNMASLIQGADQLGIALSPEQVDRFRRYQDLLLEWNERINLTSLRTPAHIQQRHFLDSLSCASATGDLTGQTLIDVGSGAGFPGLPLKIIFPGLRLTLLESIGKKAAFLEMAVQELEIAGVQVVCARAEDIGQMEDHREVYDWAVARAVARLSVLAEYLLPLVRLGGFMLAQKGRSAAEGLGEAEKAISSCGGGHARLLPVHVPGEDEVSNLILIEKIQPTPIKYPRRAGIPGKRPL